MGYGLSDPERVAFGTVIRQDDTIQRTPLPGLSAYWPLHISLHQHFKYSDWQHTAQLVIPNVVVAE